MIKIPDDKEFEMPKDVIEKLYELVKLMRKHIRDWSEKGLAEAMAGKKEESHQWSSRILGLVATAMLAVLCWTIPKKHASMVLRTFLRKLGTGYDTLEEIRKMRKEEEDAREKRDK